MDENRDGVTYQHSHLVCSQCGTYLVGVKNPGECGVCLVCPTCSQNAAVQPTGGQPAPRYHDNAVCGVCGGPLEVERDVICEKCANTGGNPTPVSPVAKVMGRIDVDKPPRRVCSICQQAKDRTVLSLGGLTVCWDCDDRIKRSPPKRVGSAIAALLLRMRDEDAGMTPG